MFITEKIVRELEISFGEPDEVTLTYEMKPLEFEMVRRSQKHGRSHDVTLFIVRGGDVVVIKKPMYPAGAYRAPSGGVAPGEDFVAGALREAYEETGLEVELERYLLRARVAFTCDGDVLNWTTHVFRAKIISGELQPIDTREIVEARFASLDELRGPIREALLASGSTGLRYRAELGDLILSRLIHFANGDLAVQDEEEICAAEVP